MDKCIKQYLPVGYAKIIQARLGCCEKKVYNVMQGKSKNVKIELELWRLANETRLEMKKQLQEINEIAKNF